MSFFKRLLVIITCIFFLGQSMIAQSGQTSTGEKTVEDIYLQDSIEALIIKDSVQSSNMQTKEIGLQLIKQALDNGKKSKEIFESLRDLSLESTKVITTEGGYGKPKNNFPLLRAKACEYLGTLGTPEAQRTLLEVLDVEKEPTVLASAIYALGTIKKNENNEVSQKIARVFKGFHVTRPDDNLAMAVLLAFEKLAENSQLKDPDAVEAIRLIMEGNYNPVVREKAKALYYKKVLGSTSNKK